MANFQMPPFLLQCSVVRADRSFGVLGGPGTEKLTRTGLVGAVWAWQIPTLDIKKLPELSGAFVISLLRMTSLQTDLVLNVQRCVAFLSNLVDENT